MNTLTHVLSSFISPITSLSLHQCLSIVSFLTLTLVQETTRGETVHQEEAGPLLLGMDRHPKSKYWNSTKSPTKTNPIQSKLKTKFVASNPIQSNYKRSKSIQISLFSMPLPSHPLPFQLSRRPLAGDPPDPATNPRDGALLPPPPPHGPPRPRATRPDAVKHSSTANGAHSVSTQMACGLVSVRRHAHLLCSATAGRAGGPRLPVKLLHGEVTGHLLGCSLVTCGS